MSRFVFSSLSQALKEIEMTRAVRIRMGVHILLGGDVKKKIERDDVRPVLPTPEKF